jgi:hypothetical protein
MCTKTCNKSASVGQVLCVQKRVIRGICWSSLVCTKTCNKSAPVGQVLCVQKKELRWPLNIRNFSRLLPLEFLHNKQRMRITVCYLCTLVSKWT